MQALCCIPGLNVKHFLDLHDLNNACNICPPDGGMQQRVLSAANAGFRCG